MTTVQCSKLTTLRRKRSISTQMTTPGTLMTPMTTGEGYKLKTLRKSLIMTQLIPGTLRPRKKENFIILSV